MRAANRITKNPGRFATTSVNAMGRSLTFGSNLHRFGPKNEALTQLEKCVPVHSTALAALKIFPIYDPLRSDPRFAALLRTVHLSE
jgi:hypothetical protein